MRTNDDAGKRHLKPKKTMVALASGYSFHANVMLLLCSDAAWLTP
jgi:hypothetical protein